ncbi:MAG: T9SS C-terminal target domain-containing protein [Bacteroidetes bacterium]|nr:MAG: T9SS C-terminal target domain-containing protein [Bacteroidota bacterium]
MKILLLIFVFLISILFCHAQNTITVNTVSGSPFCAGSTITVPFTTTGTFSPANTFTIEFSDASGSFANPINIGTLIGQNAGSAFADIPANTPSGMGYKVRVSSNAPSQTSLNASNAFTVQSVSANPNIFGNNVWNVYVYKDYNFTQYVGSYTENSLSFDSQNKYTQYASPMTAGGYSGCNVGNTNYSVSYKRTNFACGYYQVDLPIVDDEVVLMVDGVNVYQKNTYSTNLLNVWRGYLGTNSQVEFRHKAGTGGNILIANFSILPDQTTVSADANICASGSTVLSVSNPVALSYLWSPSANLSSSSGANVTANPTSTTVYSVTGTHAASGCSITKFITVTVGATPALSISPTSATVCAGQSVNLNASGSGLYTWSPSASLNTTSGGTVIATPNATTTYFVTGNNGCSNTFSSVTVIVGSGVDPNIFGNNSWRAYAYNGTFANPVMGVYTANGLNFDSRTAWVNGNNGSPSSAAGYVGCAVGVDNHSVSYKRQGFVCGIYQIDIPYHDDGCFLLIDGVQVFAHNGCCDVHNNVWKGFLGTNSKVEFRWNEGTGGSGGAVNFTLLPLIPSPDPTICTGTSVVLSAQNIAGTTYTWTPNTSLSATNTASVTANPVSTTTYTCTAFHSASGCTINQTTTVNVTDVVLGLNVTSSQSIICVGQSNTLTATGGNNYVWSPNLYLNTNLGSVVIANPPFTTTYTVSADGGCGIMVTAQITVQVGAGNPNIFGNNVWNVYAYNDNNFTQYAGFYTENNMNFASDTRWVNGSNGTPSSANALSGSAYVGCSVGIDNHSVSYKRTNFACGYYQIDITKHDDDAFLYIDNVLVWQHLGCCDAHANVWQGFLGANSKVEFKWKEGGGGSNGGMNITNISSAVQYTSPSVTICQGSSANLNAFLSVYPSMTYSWSSNLPLSDLTLSSNTGNNVTAFVSGANNATINVIGTDPITNCSLNRSIFISVQPLPNTKVTPISKTICRGESVFLTASGAYTYSWTPNSSLTFYTALGYIVEAKPLNDVIYTVSGGNNCDFNSANVFITVKFPSLTGTEFGNNVWNVFAYSGNNINPNQNLLRGHYTENSLSLDSRSRWGEYLSPSSASGYVGCDVPVDNHSVIYKRTNFPCGVYRIDIPNHDDGCQLFVNGVQVFSHIGCCDSHYNVWQGVLTSSSTVEFRWQEGTGGSHGGINLAFASQTATQTTWTGAVNNDWFNLLNWCSTIPTSTIDVLIPALGVNFMPMINTSGAVCKNLVVENNATLTINGTNNLAVYGNWQCDGTFNSNNSTVNFLGNSSNTIGGSSSGSTFYNMILNKANQTLTMQNAIAINQNLNLTNGGLILNSNSLIINNAFATAIVRQNNAFIQSETNAAYNPSQICWNTGNNTGSFVFPFGVSATEYIPVTISKNDNTTTIFCVSTRGTGAANMPLSTGTYFGGGASGYDLIDRWWDINSSINPLPVGAVDLILSYRGSENTLPVNPNNKIRIQHFDNVTLKWDLPFAQKTTSVTSGIGTVHALGINKFSPFVAVSENNILPVKLLYFSAKKSEKTVILNWETTSESNNAYFVVQKSRDLQNILSVDTLKILHANSSENKKYQMVDQKPFLGKSYYRLLQIDLDGTENYSKWSAVEMEDLPKNEIIFYPNPTNSEEMNLQFLGKENEEIQIIFNDLMGKEIFRQNHKSDATGRLEIALKAPNLPAGIYFCGVKTSDFMQFVKVILEK